MISDALYSSESVEWITPERLFCDLDREFHFDLDPAASDQNAKCDVYYTVEDNGLTVDWYNPDDDIISVFVNPPYGRGIGAWVEKAYMESQKGATVVMLLPARTDTSWFHDYILGKAELRLLRGRLRFLVRVPEAPFAESSAPAPFPSMIVVFRPPHAKGIM